MTWSTQKLGVTFGIGAAVWWGVAPIYWRLLDGVPIGDLIAHRVLWSIPVLMLALVLTGRLASACKLLFHWASLRVLIFSAVLGAVNWLIFLWAVATHQVAAVSLGYFLLPLIRVVFGVLVFKETLDGAQKLAIAFAVLGLVTLTIGMGGLPWAALGVALSFGAYGAVRKAVVTDAIDGVFIEMLVLAPFAIGWVVYSYGASLAQGRGVFTDLMLVAAGLITALPLMAYVAASRLASLSSLGLISYLNPTVQLFIAVCYFGEPLEPIKFFAYSMVWVGLILYMFDQFRKLGKRKYFFKSLSFYL